MEKIIKVYGVVKTELSQPRCINVEVCVSALDRNHAVKKVISMFNNVIGTCLYTKEVK